MKRSRSRPTARRLTESGEFLWLISLSDLMILLFIFFVVLFSLTYKKLRQSDFDRIVAALRHREIPQNPIDKIRGNLNEWVKAEHLDNQITITRAEDSVTMQIKDQVLFESGAYELSPLSYPALHALARTLERIPSPYHIGIVGNTDDNPVHLPNIRDNWELSAKRALAVLEALQLSKKTLKRTSVIAQGEMHPLLPNRDPKGNPLPKNQSQNRRVAIRIF